MWLSEDMLQPWGDGRRGVVHVALLEFRLFLRHSGQARCLPVDRPAHCLPRSGYRAGGGAVALMVELHR